MEYIDCHVAAYEPPYEAFLCPISHVLMRDPVITVDGHSYERCQIEAWFNNQSAASSPVTAALLPSKTLIPNHALRSAINKYYDTLPESVQAQIERDAAEVSVSPKKPQVSEQSESVAGRSPVSELPATPSAPSCGEWTWGYAENVADRVEVVGRVLRRKEEGGKFTDVAAFAARPLRLFQDEPMVFAVKITKATYAWRGMFIGIAPVFDPSARGSLEMHLERTGWYLDGERWFRTPLDGNNQLVELNTAKLREGDTIALQVHDDGSISFSVNGKRIVHIEGPVVDLSQPLYPWVALMGNCEEVSL